MTADHTPPCTAEEALARLKEGNARFVDGQSRFPTVQKDVLAELTKGQQPYTTILGCSDSRVPPGIVFDAHLGELFAVSAAIASKFHGAEQKSRIEVLLENILPALDDLDGKLPPKALLEAAVEANVRWTIRMLHETPEVRARYATSGMKLVGAVYELDTGRVRFLE